MNIIAYCIMLIGISLFMVGIFTKFGDFGAIFIASGLIIFAIGGGMRRKKDT